jgi:hypothetical protein
MVDDRTPGKSKTAGTVFLCRECGRTQTSKVSRVRCECGADMKPQ